MNISYSNPLTQGWNRMKKALFQPFEIGKWFTIGFTAFLAGIAESGGPGGGNYSNKFKGNDFDWEEIAEYPYIAWSWLMDNPLWFSLIIAGIFLVFVLAIVFTWLSSRGKFMFLDNVIHDKAEVVKPWYNFRKEGNSLFLWRLVFGLISFILIMTVVVISGITIFNLFTGDSPIPEKIFTIVGFGLLFLILCIIMSYISLFLSDFVVPIMYKNRITTSEAWFKFLPIMSKHIGYFLLYGLFVFVLIILIVLCVIIFGLFTCCIGFLLLVIPYIGSVVFLPISYTYRAFSVEFLEQFGDDFTLFPQPEIMNNDLPEKSE